jgi:hypothetical protein
MVSQNGLKESDHYIYTPSTTDVTIRWKSIYGWVPPTEDPKYRRKWAEFRRLLAAGIETFDKAKK